MYPHLTASSARFSKARNAVRIGLMLTLFPAALAWSEDAWPEQLPTLTTAEEVRELTPDQANRGYPVHLRAVLTYIDFSVGDFFVQDSTAGIYVDEHELRHHFRPGDLLEINGVTEEPDFAPQIGKAHYRVLGQSPLPWPRKVGFGDMLSTREDSQWVQVEGIVQDFEPDHDGLSLYVIVEGRGLLVSIMDQRGLSGDRLVDAKVRVTGVCATLYNRNNQLTGIWLAVPTARQVSVEEPPAADPFSVPIRPISSLLAFTTRNASEHRVRVQGTVTLQRPRGVFIQNGRLGVYIPGPTKRHSNPATRSTWSVSPIWAITRQSFDMPSSGEQDPRRFLRPSRSPRRRRNPAPTILCA